METKHMLMAGGGLLAVAAGVMYWMKMKEEDEAEVVAALNGYGALAMNGFGALAMNGANDMGAIHANPGYGVNLPSSRFGPQLQGQHTHHMGALAMNGAHDMGALAMNGNDYGALAMNGSDYGALAMNGPSGYGAVAMNGAHF